VVEYFEGELQSPIIFNESEVPVMLYKVWTTKSLDLFELQRFPKPESACDAETVYVLQGLH
jgi:hypothetical protein